MKIDRWNGGTLRRYHHPSGAKIVVNSNRNCAAIPAWCQHISSTVSRTEAATMILEWRAAR